MVTHKKALLIACLYFFVQNLSFSQNKYKGIDINNMDLKVSPKDDFYKFANGGWLNATKIPDDRTKWGSFSELRKITNDRVQSIYTEAIKSSTYSTKTDEGKAIALYRTILDVNRRNADGVSPIQPLLKKISALKSFNDYENFIIENASNGKIALFSFSISADSRNSSKNQLSLDFAQLGLPDKDYYVSNDKEMIEIRKKYVAHIQKMFTFLGESPVQAEKEAKKILAFETSLARSSYNRVEQRDVSLIINTKSLSDIQKQYPKLNWKKYFTGIGIANIDTMNVSCPRFFEKLEKVYAENKIEDWKLYFKWMVLNNAASSLSLPIYDQNFNFYGKTLNGSIKPVPLNEWASNVISDNLGEALGKIYVQKYFPEKAKLKAEKLIKNLILAFRDRINNLAWMSDETKAKAQEKLNKLTIKIAYPDKWKDYSAVSIQSPEENGSFYLNSENLTKWKFKEEIDKLNKPVDKSEWEMAPQIVNAYYSSNNNEIVFPAAILQAPFYDFDADDAINYGGIGGVIGHEISHGFDDQGAKFNADGNLINWWTEKDLIEFNKLGSRLADQYSALSPLPGVHVDGKFTLGENIGDLGGTNAAYDALQIAMKENGNPGLIDGYTPEQRFFLSWATIWRGKIRDEAIRNNVKIDPHSPEIYRGYVPLLNLDTFHKAFDINEGDKMWLKPENRVKLW